MKYPLATGQASQILGVTEPQLSETIRRGKVVPPPQVFAGRRLWHPEHLLQAAKALNVLTDRVRSEIESITPALRQEARP